MNNIYDFDNGPMSRNIFDVSACYTNKEKKLFGIKFNYPTNIDLGKQSKKSKVPNNTMTRAKEFFKNFKT